MKRKLIVFLFVITLFIISTLYKSYKQDINKVINDKKENNEISTIINNDKLVSINLNNEIKTIDMTNYLIGVLSCEMPASFEIDALKALSIAARTYATYKINKGSSLETTISDQCYLTIDEMKEKWSNNYDKYYNKIKNAVESTNNLVMTYDNKVIQSFYFSISNGYTESSEKVFNQKLDYLVSVESLWDSKYDYKEYSKTISYEDFYKTLKIDDIKSEDIIISRTDSNRVDTITIKSRKYKGTEFRKLFNIRSTDFEIELSDNIIIKTKGYGHGVGMSQYGANAMALLGYNYIDILNHYYSDIEIVNNY